MSTNICATDIHTTNRFCSLVVYIWTVHFIYNFMQNMCVIRMQMAIHASVRHTQGPAHPKTLHLWTATCTRNCCARSVHRPLFLCDSVCVLGHLFRLLGDCNHVFLGNTVAISPPCQVLDETQQQDERPVAPIMAMANMLPQERVEVSRLELPLSHLFNPSHAPFIVALSIAGRTRS